MRKVIIPFLIICLFHTTIYSQTKITFYLEDIPVLHFFTGQHADYHKASDDSPLVNFEGIAEISGYIVDVIESLDTSGELAFTKTKDEQQQHLPLRLRLLRLLLF